MLFTRPPGSMACASAPLAQSRAIATAVWTIETRNRSLDIHSSAIEHLRNHRGTLPQEFEGSPDDGAFWLVNSPVCAMTGEGFCLVARLLEETGEPCSGRCSGRLPTRTLPRQGRLTGSAIRPMIRLDLPSARDSGR